MTVTIPENEYTEEFTRSSGSGGQNVNKVETKVRIRWLFLHSTVLTNEQKDQVRRALAGHINDAGELTVESQKYRTQVQNREDAVARLHRFVERALRSRKTRIKTRPSRVAQERRLEQKRLHASKKQSRQEKTIAS